MSSSNRASSIRVGPYQLFERIGEGGTAHVHRGVTEDGRSVAVKLLAPAAELDDAAARARFDREIRALAELDHPNVVDLIDHGVDDELGPYLVTPLLPGNNLRALLAGAAVCPEAVILLLQPVVAALDALHRAGLVHRDLKPENVIAIPNGDVVLVDLGLAYRQGQTRYTEEGAVVGSVPYMAPEQVEGGEVGPASDVWAAGVMAYEWATGKRPFERGRPAEEAAAVLVGAFTPLKSADRRVGPELSDLIGECLQRDPAARPDAALLAYRIGALVDWIDPADARDELAALIADPAGYQQRVSRFRVTRLEREARVAIGRGEAFAALKQIDRALAYAPDDPKLRALSEQAEAAGAAAPRPAPPAAPAPARPLAPPRRWGAIAGVIAAAVIAAGALAFALLRDGDAPQPAAVDEPDTADEAAMQVLGGMLNLIERGVEAQQAAAAAEPPAPAPPGAVTALTPIPMSELRNDDDPRPIELAAAPGEPLVPVELLGGLDPAAAVKQFDEQVAAHPDDTEWLVGRALVYLTAGRRAEGLKLLDGVIESHPNDAGAWAAKGFVDLRRGDHDAADKSLGRAIDLDPTDAQSLRNRGILRHRQGRVRDAYVDLTRALEHDPNDADAMSELAQIYERTDRREDARPLLERIVRARPNSATAWLDLSLIQPPSQALVSVRRAQKLEPSNPRINRRLCTVQSQLADRGAVDACDKVVAAAPRDPGVYMERGLAHYALGDTERALADMDRAIAMRPNDARFLQNRYIVRSHAGMTERALQDLKQACKLGADVACNELRKRE